jgi:steroid 5-alpha reductase family enzyme
MLSTAIICFVIGELTRNYSQTDKVWSIMPIVYSLVTLNAFPSSPRIWLMSILVLIWGIRLSYNFYRKGGYDLLPWKGEEDYRWAMLRQHPKLQKGIRFTLFNLFFISIYQHVLILLFSLPILFAAKYTETDLSVLDYVAASFMLLFILIETISDNQLHVFQFHKRKKIALDGKYSTSLKKGFLTEGLWNYVRHPNYVAEQATWISFYFFGVAASGIFINITLTGPVLLIFLFMGSSEFTERISLDKYPDYKNYKEHVPKFIPLLFKSRKEHKQ